MKKRMVCYGTSLTSGSGWVKMLNKALPDWRVINSGEGGMNSNWGVDNFDKKVLKYNPQVVLMEFAVNDAYIRDNFCGKLDIKKSLQNIRYMVEKLRWAKVYYMTMNPPYDMYLMGRNPKDDRPDWQHCYIMHRSVANKSGAEIINITPKWQALDQDEFLRLCPDGLHPNEQGSKEITVPTILERLGL